MTTTNGQTPEPLATAPETAAKPGRKLASYTEADVERGLLQVALCGGNTRLANRQLKEAGHSIPRGTLRKWADTIHPERYAEIHKKVVPQIHEAIAAESEDLARGYAELERNALDRLRISLPKLDPRDLPNVVRNAATARGISTDKSLVMRNRPTAIVEHRDAREVLRKLVAAGVATYIEGEAEEIPPAEQLPPGGTT